jgi:hypothetical protein
VALGEGKRLFGDGTIPRTWRLIAAKPTSTGAILASYAPADRTS